MRIPINLNDYKEPTTAPIGKYDILIASCDEAKTRAAGKPQFVLSIGFEGHPEFQNMRHYLGIPSDMDDADAMGFKALGLRRFLTLFGQPVPKDGLDTEQLAMQLVGARAKADVILEKETDSQGNEKPDGRVFNRLVVPRLRDESQAAGARVSPTPPKR